MSPFGLEFANFGQFSAFVIYSLLLILFFVEGLIKLFQKHSVDWS